MPTTLRDYALLGAKARLQQIQSETEALIAMFPQLKAGSSPAPVRKKRKVSAAQRKATSIRMKRYWAERKKAAKKAR